MCDEPCAAATTSRPQYAASEAEVVAQAGRMHAVTIATNMAGRGTDILLGGNSEGLARQNLEAALARNLCDPVGDPAARAAGVLDTMAHVSFGEDTKTALMAAEFAVVEQARAEDRLPMSLEVGMRNRGL